MEIIRLRIRGARVGGCSVSETNKSRHEEAFKRRMRAGSGPVVDANDTMNASSLVSVRVYARLPSVTGVGVLYDPRLKRGRKEGQGKLQACTWVGRLVSRILLARGYSLKTEETRGTVHRFGKLLTKQISCPIASIFPPWCLYRALSKNLPSSLEKLFEKEKYHFVDSSKWNVWNWRALKQKNKLSSWTRKIWIWFS